MNITHKRIEYIDSLLDLRDTTKVLFEVKQFLIEIMDVVEQSPQEEIIIKIYNELSEELDYVYER